MSSAKRVLIVEDDVHIANLLRMHLRDEGYEVTHAATGDEGLALLEAQPWSALVLDLMLPGVDGLEICRRARGMARYTPIIITSARASEVHRILFDAGTGGAGQGAAAPGGSDGAERAHRCR
jgi:DNA-binding response OmpR family regulator